MHLQKIEVSKQETDPDDSESSHHRILVDRTHFKYVTIDPGVYGIDDLCFSPSLLGKLPAFPVGDWNCGRLGQTVDNPFPHLGMTSREILPSINIVWYPKSFVPANRREAK